MPRSHLDHRVLATPGALQEWWRKAFQEGALAILEKLEEAGL
jgi:hypothetical protein